LLATQIWLFVGLACTARKARLPAVSGIRSVLCRRAALHCMPVGEFFASFQTEDIKLTPKVNEYLSLAIQLMFAFGFVFECC
jgi:hypothetical protein